MLASMTGYGMADGSLFGGSIRIEIRSINSRYFDFSSRVPSLLNEFEGDFKKLIQKKIKRGKVSVFVVVTNNTLTSSVKLDERKVLFYLQALKKVGRKYGIKGNLQLNDILYFPDIFVAVQRKYSQNIFKKRIFSIFRKAVNNLMIMKLKEGENIAKDLWLRINKIEKTVREIEQSSMSASSRFKKKLNQRIRDLDKDIKVSRERLEAEIALFADKCDITEEIVRIKSHINIFRKVLSSSGEGGKRLEFIAQEINREANTIASKSQSARISQDVITIRLEVEKIREQVQNIE